MSSPFEAPSPTTVAPADSRTEEQPIRRTRTASITQSILDSNPYYGVLAAAGEALAHAPSLKDLRRNSVGSGNSRGRRASSVSAAASPRSETGLRAVAIDEEEAGRKSREIPVRGMIDDAETKKDDDRSAETLVQDGGEHDEVKHAWWQITVNGLKAFWKFFTKPLGFFVTIYMLNVVAWGGMLFLLLCNAAPAMCVPDCNDINSPRRKWIEIDSQILNALFCVTGFGLVPWRFRDLYFLLSWRLFSDMKALHKLEVIHGGWFRGPSGVNTAHTATGKVAPLTKSWKMDYVVWLYVWNTFFQCVLSGFMWGMNRYNRPSWSTGLFVALACIVAGMAGGQVWWETKQVKKVEGERIVDTVEIEGGRKEKAKDKGRKFWAREERNVVVVNRLTG
ncbi:hypothetical protein L873DRAFT_1787802 [Choiromyces venosus 120613-1]|uniref:Alpha-l-rhamnosidase c protein n=1 Tax=Choiromyces venosus 120613-1 TaxID=1336337 RepID=A0A3N4JYW7_9PEZI|nr:hypothetical protein L873DRAFT_1787802 [Choiromyces venosus 120613-1]